MIELRQLDESIEGVVPDWDDVLRRAAVPSARPARRRVALALALAAALALVAALTSAGATIVRQLSALIEKPPPPVFKKLRDRPFPLHRLPQGLTGSPHPSRSGGSAANGWELAWTFRGAPAGTNGLLLTVIVQPDPIVAKQRFRQLLRGVGSGMTRNQHFIPTPLPTTSFAVESTKHDTAARSQCRTATTVCSQVFAGTVIGRVMILEQLDWTTTNPVPTVEAVNRVALAFVRSATRSP